MKNYSILAKYYDRFSHNDCDYESWSQYLLNEAKKTPRQNGGGYCMRHRQNVGVVVAFGAFRNGCG